MVPGNSIEREPRILRDLDVVPETFDNLVDETQDVGVSSNGSTSTISAAPSVALSWLNQIKSPWNLTGLVKKLEARSNKTPVKLVLKVDSPGKQRFLVALLALLKLRLQMFVTSRQLFK